MSGAFAGQQAPDPAELGMNEYQVEAARACVWKHGGDYPRAMTALGLCEEAGEVAAIIRKAARDGHEVSREDLADELGDVLWGVAQMATLLGVDLEAVAARNLRKMRTRHASKYVEGANATV